MINSLQLPKNHVLYTSLTGHANFPLPSLIGLQHLLWTWLGEKRWMDEVIISASVTRCNDGRSVCLGGIKKLSAGKDGGRWIKRLFVGHMDLAGQGEQVSVVSRRTGNWGRTVGLCVWLLNGDPGGDHPPTGVSLIYQGRAPVGSLLGWKHLRTGRIQTLKTTTLRELDLNKIRPKFLDTTVTVIKWGASVTCDWSVSIFACRISDLWPLTSWHHQFSSLTELWAYRCVARVLRRLQCSVNLLHLHPLTSERCQKNLTAAALGWGFKMLQSDRLLSIPALTHDEH